MGVISNKKGQGLTEYGIILLLILGVGLGVYYGFNIKAQVGDMYSTVSSDLRSIIDDITPYSDDVETYIMKQHKNKNKVGPFTFHKTSLSAADLFYDGTTDSINNGQANDNSIWWFINSSGYKEYKVGKSNAYGTGMLQEVPYTVKGVNKTNAYGFNLTGNDTATTYFKATDGNTYQITYYANNPTGTTLTQYTGDTKGITYVTNAYSGYTDGTQRYK